MTKRKAMHLGLALAVALLGCSAQAEDLAPSILPSQLEARIQAGTAPVIVDVRTAEEFRSGHVPGAVNIPYDRITEHVDELRSERGVAVYCMRGPRARLGEQTLLLRGVPGILHVEGGFSAWQESGLPVDR